MLFDWFKRNKIEIVVVLIFLVVLAVVVWTPGAAARSL